LMLSNCTTATTFRNSNAKVGKIQSYESIRNSKIALSSNIEITTLTTTYTLSINKFCFVIYPIGLVWETNSSQARNF
jgi:hypothetical protein